MNLREQFKATLNLENKSLLEQLFLDSTQNYVIWLEKKLEIGRLSAIDEAKYEVVKLNAMKELVKDNSLGCEITIGDLKFGVCNNLTVLPAIQNNLDEITKFLNGEPNDWE